MDMMIENPWIIPEVLSKHLDNKGSYLKGLVDKVATLELRENKHTKEESLRRLQEWIQQNSDIENCITDDAFLLRFLRAKKYSLIMAQQTLLKYLNLRKTFPRVFFNMDYRDPNVNEIISNGYIYASPFRDSKGRRVIITTGRYFDPLKYSSVDMARAHIITYETVLDNEIDQVLGVVHVGDTKGCGSAFVTLWNINEFITLVRWGEQSFPMRHKEIHVLHIPQVLKYAYDFCVGILSNKIKKRVFIYDRESDLHNKINCKLLPKEYGGVMPMSEMIKLWKQELESKRERLLSYDSVKLLSDRGIIRRRNKNVLTTDEVGSVPGSFRKLEVD